MKNSWRKNKHHIGAGSAPGGGGSAAQAGHRQDWLRALSGICASAAGETGVLMHQQSSGGSAALTAH